MQQQPQGLFHPQAAELEALKMMNEQLHAMVAGRTVDFTVTNAMQKAIVELANNLALKVKTENERLTAPAESGPFA